MRQGYEMATTNPGGTPEAITPSDTDQSPPLYLDYDDREATADPAVIRTERAQRILQRKAMHLLNERFGLEIQDPSTVVFHDYPQRDWEHNYLWWTDTALHCHKFSLEVVTQHDKVIKRTIRHSLPVRYYDVDQCLLFQDLIDEEILVPYLIYKDGQHEGMKVTFTNGFKQPPSIVSEEMHDNSERDIREHDIHTVQRFLKDLDKQLGDVLERSGPAPVPDIYLAKTVDDMKGGDIGKENQEGAAQINTAGISESNEKPDHEQLEDRKSEDEKSNDKKSNDEKLDDKKPEDEKSKDKKLGGKESDDDIFMRTLDHLSEAQLREDELFEPPYQPSKPPRTPKDFQHIGERFVLNQWNKLWQDVFERVKGRQTAIAGGTYDPIKEKRVFDRKKGEVDRYDPIQGKEGSLEWAIDQLMECYMCIKATMQEIEEKRAQAEIDKGLLEEMQESAKTGDYDLFDDLNELWGCIEDQRQKVQVQNPNELHQLQVRKALLKKAAENHLWQIGKQDHKYKYRGEMLRGLLAARKFFADTTLDVTDEELKFMKTGIKIQKTCF
ncbi:hypothetical protein Dda_0665 [Drechslerella dactyloides]|uniref:Uncharacterized protein n=1 Tax=Drechslerella dactyloides TaxID=74499 RepID=A0AAD6NP89_DREDA|nr:hypothetical protein Dda_0665 [Drechslerella dactyloides]